MENGDNFTVVDDAGLPLFVVLSIDCSGQAAFKDANACSEHAASVYANENPYTDKCSADVYFAPVTPDKTALTKRKQSSNLLDGARNNGTSKHQINHLETIQEDDIADESDDQVTESAKTIQEKARRKKHRPKVINNEKVTQKPVVTKPSASEKSIKSCQKNVKKKGPIESTPVEVNRDPDEIGIRKLPKRSCKRALVFDAEGELKDVGVLTKQESTIAGKLEYSSLHYKRKRTTISKDHVRKITDGVDAKTIRAINDQAESSAGKKLDWQIEIYDPKVALGNTSEDIPNQLLELHLNINSKESNNINQEHSALVHHSEEGTMVPYERPFDPAERPRQRAKVHLDEETSRVWKLLLADINSPGVDGVDEENMKCWDEERAVYRGLADLFIGRMHLVQGDKQFSPWKGSVVDSVVGAFLTQNVSDHLSSSAFIKLASNFLPESKINKSSCLEKQTAEVSTIIPGLAKDAPNPLRTGVGSKTDGEASSSKKKAIKSDFSENSEDIQDRKSKRKAKKKEVEIDWDILRKEVQATGQRRERPEHAKDSVDWEAVRFADVDKISNIIRERGMNQKLAQRIQDFLNRIARDHESVDLEWLRDIAPDKAKEFLLSIYGLGLKSVECVRLLTLHHLAFPVDTNVGRVAVRLGWVPLQPLPESLQLHLLELYPMLNTIQKYLWPRLCKLDQKTLYELHYQMITFGKVFCTKSKPNCNACPMKGDCRHYASAFASSKLALPGPENGATYLNSGANTNPNPITLTLPPASTESKESWQANKAFDFVNNEPIIEEPGTPEPEYNHIQEIDIEDSVLEVSDDEVPEMIKLNIEEFTQTLQNYAEKQDGDMSKALVALTPEAASIPMPKLKKVNQLRTQHQVYELPDFHPLLTGFDKREPDDPGRYLLAIWTAGETADSTQQCGNSCEPHEPGKLCEDQTCFSCNSIREENSHFVRGTILIPCRTAMRGSFPLNGTYFQVNEVFADHESSITPIRVPRDSIWNFPRRMVYFGTSVTSIFKGLTTEEIQHCFWRGYVCIRAFDRKTRAPRPLMSTLHTSGSKSPKAKVKKNDKDASLKTAVKFKAQKKDREINAS